MSSDRPSAPVVTGSGQTGKGPGGFGVDQLEVERRRDLARNLVLQGEQIAGVSREALCPQMRVGFGVD